jgi:two-component system, NarL family, nitrate/nitrite response regulator NarL
MGAAGIQVAVCSANRLLREAVGTTLAQRPAVCLAGLTHDLADLIRLCGLRPVDVALIDVHGDFAAVVEGVRTLRTTRPDRGIVLTYSALAASDVVVAVGAGATSLIPYSRGVSAVMEAVEEGPRPPAVHPSSLTDRDLEIVRLVGSGYNVKEIAGMLGIAPSTVENHKRRIYAKLNGHSGPQVVSHAARLGLLRTEPHASVVNLVIVFGPSGPQRELVVECLIRQAVAVPRSASVRAALTHRELEILDSIAHGHSVRQTADVLGISGKTVENIQARLFAKLAVRNRAESLAVAYELGLVSGDAPDRDL